MNQYVLEIAGASSSDLSLQDSCDGTSNDSDHVMSSIDSPLPSQRYALLPRTDDQSQSREPTLQTVDQNLSKLNLHSTSQDFGNQISLEISNMNRVDQRDSEHHLRIQGVPLVKCDRMDLDTNADGCSPQGIDLTQSQLTEQFSSTDGSTVMAPNDVYPQYIQFSPEGLMSQHSIPASRQGYYSDTTSVVSKTSGDPYPTSSMSGVASSFGSMNDTDHWTDVESDSGNLDWGQDSFYFVQPQRSADILSCNETVASRSATDSNVQADISEVEQTSADIFQYDEKVASKDREQLRITREALVSKSKQTRESYRAMGLMDTLRTPSDIWNTRKKGECGEVTLETIGLAQHDKEDLSDVLHRKITYSSCELCPTKTFECKQLGASYVILACLSLSEFGKALPSLFSTNVYQGEWHELLDSLHWWHALHLLPESSRFPALASLSFLAAFASKNDIVQAFTEKRIGSWIKDVTINILEKSRPSVIGQEMEEKLEGDQRRISILTQDLAKNVVRISKSYLSRTGQEIKGREKNEDYPLPMHAMFQKILKGTETFERSSKTVKGKLYSFRHRFYGSSKSKDASKIYSWVPLPFSAQEDPFAVLALLLGLPVVSLNPLTLGTVTESDNGPIPVLMPKTMDDLRYLRIIEDLSQQSLSVPLPLKSTALEVTNIIISRIASISGRRISRYIYCHAVASKYLPQMLEGGA